MHSMLEKAQKAAGVTLNIKYEVQQVQTQIAMAAAGLGAAILPRIAIPVKPDPRLRAVPISDPPLVREWCVVTLRGQFLSQVASRFVEMLDRLMNRADAPADGAPGTPVIIRPAIARHRGHLSLASNQLAVPVA
jgi:DNA-binding transcriptional LysR family regulator